MPKNLNALIRHRTIDNCLRNSYRKWTWDELAEECSKTLMEFRGRDETVSKRTVMRDLADMRNGALGYQAPILTEGKYYRYKDTTFSITNCPLIKSDVDMLNEALLILKQFKGFKHFQCLEEIIGKLEHTVNLKSSRNASTIIEFENSVDVKGIEFLQPIYNAILEQHVLKISYKAFHFNSPKNYILHPYLLKQYRNRWFILGLNEKSRKISVFALDRICKIEREYDQYIVNTTFNPESYFKHIIGITIPLVSKVERVLLQFSTDRGNYIKTKPMHASQTILSDDENGLVIQLEVIPNFELIANILSHGTDVKVIEPQNLINEVANTLRKAASQYQKV